MSKSSSSSSSSSGLNTYSQRTPDPRMKVKEEPVTYYQQYVQPYHEDQEDHEDVFYQHEPKSFNGLRPQIRGGEAFRQRPVYDNRIGYQQRPYNSTQPRGHQTPRPQFNPYTSKRFEQKSKKRDMCHTCGALGHHSKDCDYNVYQIQDQNEDPDAVQKMTFFKSEFVHNSLSEHWKSLIGETANKAIIDTGAVSTVCGRAWYEKFWKSLSDKERKEVKTEHCEKTFLFGDSQEVQAKVRKKLPVSICGVDILLSTYLVENDIPLLISAESMIKMRLVIDLNNQKVQFMGKSDTYQLTNSGHIVISIKKKSVLRSSLSQYSLRNVVKQRKSAPAHNKSVTFYRQKDERSASDSNSDDSDTEYPIILPPVRSDTERIHFMDNHVFERHKIL